MQSTLGLLMISIEGEPSRSCLTPNFEIARRILEQAGPNAASTLLRPASKVTVDPKQVGRKSEVAMFLRQNKEHAFLSQLSHEQAEFE